MYDSNLINKIKKLGKNNNLPIYMNNGNDGIEQILNRTHKTENDDTDDLLKELLRSNNKDEPVN